MQAHLAGVQIGRQELQQMQKLNQKLERAINEKRSDLQAAADKEAAAAVQAAAHVASLENHIQELKVSPLQQRIRIFSCDTMLCHLSNSQYAYVWS